MAVRLGFFTGNLYDSTVDLLTIKECCILLNYKEPVFTNDPLIIKKGLN